MLNNFFITGKKGIGKSTLVNKLEKSLNINAAGFKTLPFKIQGEVKGHYFHSLTNNLEFENNLPFTIRHKKTNCISVDEVFNTLGVSCLKSSLLDTNKFIILDEVGFAESNSTEFIELIYECLNSEKIVISVLKKSDNEHINIISSRFNCFVVDLDNTDYETAYNLLHKKILEELN